MRVHGMIVAVALSGAVTALWPARATRGADPSPRRGVGAALSDADDAEDRYKVPDGSPEDLLKFIVGLEQYKPKDIRDARVHKEKATAAIRAAAVKIVETEKDQTSEAYKKAAKLASKARLDSIGEASPEEQRKIFDEIKKSLPAPGELTAREAAKLDSAATNIEYSGNTALAYEFYDTLGKLFAQSKDEQIQEMAKDDAAKAYRFSLKDKFFDVSGVTVDDKEFDWSKYRGKVVLVDFWASWCGPCCAELPNVKANYAKYHDKGFDVVGISIDEDREKLEEAIEQEKIPWTTLNEDRAGWKSAIAKKYGISGIPTVILVDKEGKVVSFNARGKELGKLLAKLLGPVGGEDEKEKTDKDDDDGDSA